MSRLLAALAAAALALLSTVAHAAPVAGDWIGVIQATPTVGLHVAAHFKPASGNGWSGTLDSLDQGAMGLPLADISQAGDTLSFAVPVVHGAYTGHWKAATHAWEGTWSQGGRDMALTLTAGLPAPTAKVEGLDGAWDGALNVGAGMKLRLAVHIATSPSGTAGSLDSIDQGAMAIPLAHIDRAGTHVTFEVPAVAGRFAGDLDAGGRTLSGTWSQGGSPLPLVLTRRAPGAPEAALVRPQTPTKPFPYLEEDVAFDSADAGVRLAGTLTLPKGPGPFPAVVLIAGSGPQNRDEDILGHKVFMVLADHLTRHGVAVLRYDKRGVGRSTGPYDKATTAAFARDADAAVRFLAARRDIDHGKIGLVGHSEGGLIAPLVAVADPKVAYIVMMAGPGVDGAAVLAEQQRLIAKAMGLTDAQLATASASEARMIQIVRTEKDPAVAAARLKVEADELAAGEGISPSMAESQVAAINSDWFREFFAYDPAPTLRRLRIPVLALIGSKDLQVPPDQNLPALRAALADDPRATVEELPGLNHLFQPAATGAPSEYATIETTIAPTALDRITNWIVATAG